MVRDQPISMQQPTEGNVVPRLQAAAVGIDLYICLRTSTVPVAKVGSPDLTSRQDIHLSANTPGADSQTLLGIRKQKTESLIRFKRW